MGGGEKLSEAGRCDAKVLKKKKKVIWKELQEFCYVVVVIPYCCSRLLSEFTEKEKKKIKV